MANKKDFIASGPTKPDIAKSHFDLSYTNNLTANFGKFYPLGSWLMPAGSHFHCNCDYGFDLQPLVFPVQTNMRFHVKFYKAPLRILWKNWRNYVSRGGKGYDMPYINRDTNFYQTGSLSDYLGVPSFQTTQSTHNFSSSFYSVYPISIITQISVGDMVPYSLKYYSSSDNQVARVCFAKINSRHLLSTQQFKVRVSSLVAPTFSSNTKGLFALDRSDGNDPDFKMLEVLSVLSSSDWSVSNVVPGVYEITIPLTNVDLQGIAMIDNIYFGLAFTDGNHIGDFAQESVSYDVPEVLESTVQTGLKVPAHTITTRYSLPNKPLLLTYVWTSTTSENNATHFMSVNGAAPKLPLLAFRWRMYEFIYNYFIRNERVTPFKLPDDNGVLQQVFNQYLTNDGDGADSTTPIDFKFAPYEYDLFTTCLKKPTFGDAPLVGVSFTYDMSGNTPTGEFTLLKEGEQTPSNYQVDLDGNGNLTGISHYSGDADSPTLHRLEELIEFGISINDLRNVSAYQRFLERMTKAGTKYENIMYEFFGTNPPTGEEFPSYLGGYTDLIRTDKVLNQSMAEGTKLGEYAGNAYLRSKGGKRQIRTFCQEDCYIMAVGWFSVTPTYSQKLDKDFVYTNLLDFVNPQFASVSPQPVYDYQIAPLEIDPTDDEALHHVFGYNRPFAEAVSRQDECHGLFRSNMHNFIMQRIFGGVPELGEDFLYMKPEDLSQIFAVTETTDKIFGQIHFDVNATLPLPHMAVPRQI